MKWSMLLSGIVAVALFPGCGQDESGDTPNGRAAKSQQNSDSASQSPPSSKPVSDHVIPVAEDGPGLRPIIWDEYNVNNLPVASGLKEVETKYDLPNHPAMKALGRKAFHADPFSRERRHEDRDVPPYSFRQFSTEKDMMGVLRWYQSTALRKPPEPSALSLNGPFSDGCAATLDANNGYNHIAVIGIKHPQTSRTTIYLLHYTEQDEQPHPTLFDLPGDMREQLVELSASGYSKQKKEISREIAGRGESVIEPLLKCLTVHDSYIRSAAELVLKQVGKPAFGPLLKRVKGSDPKFQQYALDILATSEEELPPEAADLFLPLLGGPHLIQAAQVIARTGDPRAVQAVPPLIDCLEDASWRERATAVETLGKIGSPKAVGAVVELTSDRNPFVREHAVEALRQIGGPNTLGPLTRCLEDEDKDVRIIAVKALAEIGDLETLKAVGKLTTDANSRVRTEVVQALGTIGGQAAKDLIKPCLKDRSEAVRRQAERTLAEMD